MKCAAFVLAVASLAMASCAAAAQAAGPVIYPAKGQPSQQQDRDRYECHDWARGQSGYDPTQPYQVAAASPQQQPSRPSLNDMARGAAGGAAVAELTNHDAGRGAATGLVASSVVSRVREQQAMQARQAQQASQQKAAQGQARSMYERGFAACMEARGYVVK